MIDGGLILIGSERKSHGSDLVRHQLRSRNLDVLSEGLLGLLLLSKSLLVSHVFDIGNLLLFNNLSLILGSLDFFVVNDLLFDGG